MVILYFLKILFGYDSLFYKQKRVGLAGKTFDIYKFRTMVSNAETGIPVWTKKNDPRITKIGHLLRKTHLDELPQILNILKGDMSLIGPRPERPEFTIGFEKNLPDYHLRHRIKPGITGWAQVNQMYCAGEESTKIKLAYDLYYITHRSWTLDLQILFKTIKVVLSLRGH